MWLIEAAVGGIPIIEPLKQSLGGKPHPAGQRHHRWHHQLHPQPHHGR
jgi:hypothetical protein